jgi:hypothetical protein
VRRRERERCEFGSRGAVVKEKAAPSASLSEASAVLRCIEEQRDALKASLVAAEGEEMLYEVGCQATSLQGVLASRQITGSEAEAVRGDAATLRAPLAEAHGLFTPSQADTEIVSGNSSSNLRRA